MNESALQQLMGTIPDPAKPDKALLWCIIVLEFKKLNPAVDAQVKLHRAFNISYFGHMYTPLRQSGEAYIFHIVRASIRMMWRQEQLGINNLQALLYEVTHDCLEEAERSRRNRRLLESKITRQLDAKTTYGTLTLTKHKERGETNEEYFRRILKTEIWEVLWAKFEDRLDNIVTIHSMEKAKAITKIAETEYWFPQLKDRLKHLIEIEIKAGRLERSYRSLPNHLYQHLVTELRRQKQHLKLL